MEKVPVRPSAVSISAEQFTPSVSSNWRERLPLLSGAMITLRELELSDAASLLTMLSTDEVARFISPPPTTIAGFERFIHWCHQRQQQGEQACFAVVPHGMTTAIGLFQIRQLSQDFSTAEWGFALGSAYWGTGAFMDGAVLAIDFAIDALGVQRLEARAAIANGRGNGALRKIGAVQEGVLRRSFLRDGRYHDQMLWSILAVEWRQERPRARQAVRIH